MCIHIIQYHIISYNVETQLRSRLRELRASHVAPFSKINH